jgi:cytochrome c556
MTHYLAEQMRSAENASGEAKIQAQENCFKTILEIWDHRSSLPNGCRPFETFESIFRALERLDPENTNPYLEIFQRHAENSGEAKGGAEMEPSMQWLEVAFEIDRAARVWIDVVIKQAARNATDEKTKAWIEGTRDLKSNEQARLILQLVGDTASDDENGKRRQLLRERIRQLKAFAKLSKTLVAILEEELSLEQT